LIDIKENIRKNLPEFISDNFIHLVNFSAENEITSNDLEDILWSEPEYEDMMIGYINSTRYFKVSSVEEALKTFGTEYCYYILMNFIISDMAKSDYGNDVQEMLETQLFTAVSSGIIAKKVKLSDPKLAYVSGLLSYIGYIYILRYYKDEFTKIMNMEKNIIKRMNYEWETFGIDHAEISFVILESAGIIPEICNPVRNHHQKKLQDDADSDIEKNTSHALYLGSQLTNLFYEDLSSLPEFRKDIKSMTGLNTMQLEDIVEDIIDNFKIEARSLGLTKLAFSGYFKIISLYDTRLAMVQSELEIAEKKIAEINAQNLKFKKAIEDNNKKLVGLALKDPLTGAFNRRYLDERLHDEFLKAKRYDQKFALVSADIDHFKNINDSYGHAFGDLVLIEIVQIIQSVIRKTDYIARIGGEEFIIVCHCSDETGGMELAEKMRKTIETSPFRFEGNNIPVTMSFGVVNYFSEVKSVDELIRISDDRLYAAKNAGRNKVIYK